MNICGTCVYVYECVYEHVPMDMCASEWKCACVCDRGTWHDHLFVQHVFTGQPMS